MNRGAALAALLLLAGCGGDGRTVLVVNVRLADPAPAAESYALRVTVEDRDRSATAVFESATMLFFPTSFSLNLPNSLSPEVALAVRAVDRSGRTTAEAVQDVKLAQGTVEIALSCAWPCGPRADAGASDGPLPEADGGAPDAPLGPGDPCGNGKLDPGETCDVAVAAGQPNACPGDCDDNIACTIDTMKGSRCHVQCEHEEIRTPAADDRCCPAGATSSTDPDCSATCGDGVIQARETCDTGIAPGKAGACPGECSKRDACVHASLISSGTCAAVCARETVTASIAGDGCCPSGATNASDSDCPVVCGNGKVETEAGETCDRGIPAPAAGSCPTSCNDDKPCTKDSIQGSGCQAVCLNVLITEMKSDDGCCPAGGNRNVDSDCPALCGNGVVEAGEACDSAIALGKEGACPVDCPEEATGCMTRRLDGRREDCTARCVLSPVTSCRSNDKDGCCPAGCTALDDPDCSPFCGNGQVEPGETCDTGIPEGMGSCPAACADGDPCTTDALVSRDTCSAACHFIPITAFVSDDHCCPAGGNALLDNDCAAVCGNMVVEGPRELCDKAIADGKPGACPVACPAAPTCGRSVLSGKSEDCTAQCTVEPIGECRTGDGCCPKGCNKVSDGDCPAVCGNAVLEAPETCDNGLTAGYKDACPATCDDNDPCKTDITTGRVEDCTRVCRHEPILACIAGDRCCPAGCTDTTDADCKKAECGDKVIQATETCDPPGTCPTTCPDDMDPCTAERLVGDPATCYVVCSHLPITTCSATADGCCPTGCTTKQDVDCGSGLTSLSPF
jgi:hypothetical protein